MLSSWSKGGGVDGLGQGGNSAWSMAPRLFLLCAALATARSRAGPSHATGSKHRKLHASSVSPHLAAEQWTTDASFYLYSVAPAPCKRENKKLSQSLQPKGQTKSYACILLSKQKQKQKSKQCACISINQMVACYCIMSLHSAEKMKKLR